MFFQLYYGEMYIYIYFSPHDTASIYLRLLSHAFMINKRLFGNMDFFIVYEDFCHALLLYAGTVVALNLLNIKQECGFETLHR